MFQLKKPVPTDFQDQGWMVLGLEHKQLIVFLFFSIEYFEKTKHKF